MSDLAYIDNGHGVKLSEYSSHFIMVFDLTSTQQAAHHFFTLNSPINQFQLNSSFQLPCQVLQKFSLLVRKRVLFSTIRLGKFRKIIF